MAAIGLFVKLKGDNVRCEITCLLKIASELAVVILLTSFIRGLYVGMAPPAFLLPHNDRFA